MNILLIGFMGSGKSTVANRLSHSLGWPLLEMDDLVYRKTGTCDMHEVFAQGGELLLRRTEIAIAEEFAEKKNWVVSAGGGVVLNKIVLDYFKQAGAQVIFLRAKFDTIAKRLKGDASRPLFDLENARKIYDFRLPLYAAYADAAIDVDGRTVEEIAAQILGLVQKKRAANGF